MQSGAVGSCFSFFAQQLFSSLEQSSALFTNSMFMVQKYRCNPAIGKTAAMAANRIKEKQRIVLGRL